MSKVEEMTSEERTKLAEVMLAPLFGSFDRQRALARSMRLMIDPIPEGAQRLPRYVRGEN